MNISSTDLALLGLLVIIASQTSYTTYRMWRHNQRPQNGAAGMLVDTSVLMDGRITAIAETGFLPGALVIPRSVVGELQFLADNADSEKRERARRGLDVIKQLQNMERVSVELFQDSSRAPEGVDERLLALAKKHGMKLCTIDYNLNKVAQVEQIEVLNVNELARNLRMTYLPGDKVTLDLSTGGSDSHQAVGHLDDGTMVVVEQARNVIGSRQEVEIIRSLQTAAGKMMFARLSDKSLAQPSSSKKSNQKTNSAKHVAGRKPAPEAKPKSQLDTQPSTSPRRSSTQSKRNQVTTNPIQKPSLKSTTPRRKSSRQTNEDRLLDLVDSQ